MAHITSNYWRLKYWEDGFENLLQELDSVYENFWDRLLSFDDAEITGSSDSEVSGRLSDGGDVYLYGQNFKSYYAEDIIINQIVTAGSPTDINLSGNLYLGGYAGLVGNIYTIESESEAGYFSAVGDFTLDYYGSLYFLNAVEETWTESGNYLVSRIDENGNYIYHGALIGGAAIELEGLWGYEPVEAWYELLQGDDSLYGGNANDYLEGYAGNDMLFGGEGSDTALFTGLMSEYGIEAQANGLTIVTDQDLGRDGMDTLDSIERIAFSDGVIAWDTGTDGIAGQAYRIYKAAFDRSPDSTGLGYWVHQMDEGMDLIEVSARFIDSAEFKELYGTAPTNAEFLNRLYANVLDREPDEAGFEWWIDQLDNNPEKTWERVLADFSESQENQINMIEATGESIIFDLYY